MGDCVRQFFVEKDLSETNIISDFLSNQQTLLSAIIKKCSH